MAHFFYLARCADGSLYAGTCVDPDARLRKHNDGTGAKYTRSRRPVRFALLEKHATLGEARRREAEVKRWPKSRKEELAAPVRRRAPASRRPPGARGGSARQTSGKAR